MGTPWGNINHTENWERGISAVSTPGHGGIRVSRKYADDHLSKEAIREAIHWNDNYLYFEEDCDWCIPVFELPHLWDIAFRWMNSADTEDKRREHLLKSLKYWNVRYSIARNLIKEGEKFYCGNYKDGCSDGFLKVQTDTTGISFVCAGCGRLLV